MLFRKLGVIVAMIMTFIVLSLQSVYANDEVVVLTLPVQMELTQFHESNLSFQICLQPLGNSPQQEQSEISISLNSKKQFQLTFDHIGDYQYQVKQKFDDHHFDYDETIYYVHAQVIIDENDDLLVNAWITENSENVKVKEIVFNNKCLICQEEDNSIIDKIIDTGDKNDGLLWIFFTLISALCLIYSYKIHD